MGFYSLTISEVVTNGRAVRHWPLAVLVATDDGGEWTLVHAGLVRQAGRTEEIEMLMRSLAVRASRTGAGAFPREWARCGINWLLPSGLAAQPPQQLNHVVLDVESEARRIADAELHWGTDVVVITRDIAERDALAHAWGLD